jgi:predicted dehydrogenase
VSDPVSLAVVGAGAIGRAHVAAISREPGARLAAVVDPAESARAYADELGVPWHADLAALLAGPRPDGVVIATPNELHVEQGLACVAAGVAALVEKPIAVDVASARRLVEAAEAAGVPLLVGHHRRHNPLVAAAHAALSERRIGTVVAVQATCWLYKPAEYFAVDWRRRPGSGPVILNQIHDIDLMRHLVGEIVAVHALDSAAVRGHEVEDTAAVVMRFATGALGTMTVSDTVVGPWSWELTAGENPAYPATGASCYLIGGTHGSLELPGLRLWRNREARSWWEPLEVETLGVVPEDPLVRQIRQFAKVIRGEEPPLVPGRQGLRTLAVIEAMRRSAARGEPAVPEL